MGGLANQLLTLTRHQFAQRKATIGTLGNDRLVAGKTRQLPALANLLRGCKTLLGGDLLAAPHWAHQYGMEFQHFVSLSVATHKCMHSQPKNKDTIIFVSAKIKGGKAVLSSFY